MGLQAEELQAKRLLASYDRYKAREFAPATPHAVVVKPVSYTHLRAHET